MTSDNVIKINYQKTSDKAVDIAELPPDNPSDIYKSLNINNAHLPFSKSSDKQNDSAKHSQNSQRSQVSDELQSILEHRKLTTSRNMYYQNSGNIACMQFVSQNIDLASHHKSHVPKLKLNTDLSEKAQHKLNQILSDMHKSNK